ncbi:MAG: fibronectin type III domain-containing protein [Planctomycetota bacterium]|nr:fibronectin type III domain-containing protein [Planctomycetota bacterium]
MISSALILCVISLDSSGASDVGLANASITAAGNKSDLRGKIPLNELGQEISAPPAAISISAEDVAWDAGGAIKISWQPAAGTTSATKWIVERSEVLAADQDASQGAGQGPWTFVAEVPIAETNAVASKLSPDASYFFRVTAVSPNGSSAVTTTKSAATGYWNFFIGAKLPLFCAILLVSACVIYFILAARRGRPMKVRRIAALEAITDAVGRATEMGRSILFVPGIQDMDNIQTVAGLTVLGNVSRTAAEYDAAIEVPTSRSLVMEAAREAVQASYLAAGRADAYNADAIRYITDEQFGFVAYVSGRMVREKPAACFYMGCFFAESLILAETGNSIGAIQIAGTAESSQLPFFVAACDYTLIGEEFMAASAYLSGEPDQIGSLKGQDVAKAIAAIIIIIGIVLATGAAIAPQGAMPAALEWLKGVLGS